MRRKLWLGSLSKSAANTVRENVHALKLAAESGTTPERHVIAWTRKIGERMAGKLTEWGLITERAKNPSTVKLSRLCDDYLGLDRNKSWAPSTRAKMDEAKQSLIDSLHDVTIDRITVSKAKDFAAAIYEKSAESTAGRVVKRARQFFNYAVEERILESNPFDGIKASQAIDQNRKSYIPKDHADLILTKLPDSLWRSIFVLARFAGLRIPSELLALKWTSIDWELNRITIISPKQRRHAGRYTRVIPLFDSVRTELADLREIAADGDVYVCERYRTSSTAHFRKPLISAIEKAGLEVWPKLYNNLRASCRTDLLRVHPPHVVDYWLGHDAAIGSKHYDRVTDADYKRATAPTTAPILELENESTNENTVQK